MTEASNLQEAAKQLNNIIDSGVWSVYCNAMRVTRMESIPILNGALMISLADHSEAFLYDPLADQINLVISREKR